MTLVRDDSRRYLYPGREARAEDSADIRPWYSFGQSENMVDASQEVGVTRRQGKTSNNIDMHHIEPARKEKLVEGLPRATANLGGRVHCWMCATLVVNIPGRVAGKGGSSRVVSFLDEADVGNELRDIAQETTDVLAAGAIPSSSCVRHVSSAGDGRLGKQMKGSCCR